jgi:hypothetical protein
VRCLWLEENLVERDVASGRLIKVVADVLGLLSYYLTKRHNSSAFSIIVDALRVG